MAGTKDEILSRIEKQILVLDGAMGTELQKFGMPPGVCPEVWALENPSVLEKIQRAYREAGADIVYSCTFGGNPVKLGEFGYDDAEEINRKLVEISRRAVGQDVLIAGDISSTGLFVEPFGSFSFDEAVACFRRQVRGLKNGGADLFVIETQIDIQEARAALIAVREEAGDDFVMVSMTFEADGRSLNGTTPEAALVTLQSLGADAVGINCSTGPAEMLSAVKRMAGIAKVPLVAKPNAGMPVMADGKTIFPMGPKEFAEYAPAFAEAGVSLFGGCCGTTPEHIAEVSTALKRICPAPAFLQDGGASGERKSVLLSSAREALVSGPGSPLRIIGEWINPTGKKELQEELKAGDLSTVSRLAREQKELGADLLDINVGIPGADEKSIMLSIIGLLSARNDLPLVIDSSNPEVVEAAVRLYPGRALINSISGETAKLEKLIPVVKKYGSAFILLPLADSELPPKAERRMEIVRKVYGKAKEAGAGKEDILVDGLVMTVSSKPEAPAETLKTVSEAVRSGFSTVIGLSNVSFGLPAREWLNTGFLAMAQGAGVSFAIANAGNEALMNIKAAGDILRGRDPKAAGYIARFDKEGASTAGPAGKSGSVSREEVSPEDRIYNGVLNGEKEKLLAALDACLATGTPPGEILQKIMIPAILRTGELYDEKKFYLPQLMASAEAMRDGFSKLEPLLAGEDGKTAAKMIFATVQGDIHDIGKNIVVLMLRNYGFDVIDLGKDVQVEEIITAVKEHLPDILGLSALMTTTMIRMPEIISRLKDEGYDIPVMVGGAVVTPEWAESIGARYSRDGVDAVNTARQISGL